jgi:hypothetical protein
LRGFRIFRGACHTLTPTLSCKREREQYAVSDNRGMVSSKRCALFLALPTLISLSPAWAQEKPVYRCPGPPVLYTDSLNAQEAKERNCRTIEGAPITIVSAPKPRPSVASTSAVAASKPGESRIDPADQRARDSDAKRILADELRREEDRLAALRKDFNNGEPERNGDERNFQKYQERVNEMKSALARKEADVAAIKRELAKLPP